MTPRPRVSVVIPTRNRRALLARALRSVLAQEGVEVEVVVVDDGSTDETGRFLAGLGDPRVTVVRHRERRGVTIARNAGIARATACWVAFLDDDDVWAPGKLRAQLRAIERSGSAAWACTGGVLVDPHLRVLGPQEPPTTSQVTDTLLARNVVPGGASGVVAATDLVRDLGGFDTSLSSMADWDLWIRLGLRSPLASVDRPLVAYVIDAAGMAHDVATAEADLARIRTKYAGVRGERGVELDDAFWLWYLAQLHLRAGRRRAGAGAHARLAWAHRQPRRWAVAAVGLVWPGVQDLRDRRGGARMPQAWHDEIDGWLAPMRSAVAP